MRVLAIVLLLSALSLPVSGAEPDTNSLSSSTRALDSRSRESLGIGIRQLSLLLQAGPNEFFRKETLEQNGSWALLKDLESKGFVAITEASKLPNGHPMGNSVVSFSTTAKGQAVIAALPAK